MQVDGTDAGVEKLAGTLAQRHAAIVSTQHPNLKPESLEKYKTYLSEELLSQKPDLLQVIPGTRRARLGLNTPMSEALFTTMQQDMKPTHCQDLPALQLLRMVLVQHARDAVMAEHLTRMLSRLDTDGAVLIAGSWHTRTDYGVPMRVRRMAPEATVHSLAFIEVDDHILDVAGYAQGFGGETVPFDFVWFTSRVSNEEVCANRPTPPLS